MTVYKERLESVRTWLQTKDFQALLIPKGDEYLNKIVPAYAERLRWLCGFDGSAGLLVVTGTHAALFTDSRYSVQARQELEEPLFQVFDTQKQTVTGWLMTHLGKGSRLAYDPWLYSIDQIQRQEASLAAYNLSLDPVQPNPVDALWDEQPPCPSGDIFIHPPCYAGEETQDKCKRIAATLPSESCLFVTANDSLCWLLNIRGNDLPNAPLFQGYGLLEASGRAHLFIDRRKISPALREALGDDLKCWEIEKFSHTFAQLIQNKKVFLDPIETPVAIGHLIESNAATWVAQKNPCLLPKALKNETELAHMREDHVADGVALVRCFHWLESQISLDVSVGEWDLAEKLATFKRENPRYWSESFDAIVGYGPHSALIHYRPSPTSHTPIGRDSLLLVDTGTQYISGTTTDMTRTFALGSPTSAQKNAFTRVLKGHIQLIRAIFPEGTKGCHLDALARLPLWEEGLDYPHSTGHGVGSFLNVHEGPQGISRHLDATSLLPSMVVTIEPGYYQTGHFGIRLENMVEVVEKKRGKEGQRFFGFEPLTLVPFEQKLIDQSLLAEDEKKWLDHYHRVVYEKLSPFLESPLKQWLQDKTKSWGEPQR